MYEQSWRLKEEGQGHGRQEEEEEEEKEKEKQQLHTRHQALESIQTPHIVNDHHIVVDHSYYPRSHLMNAPKLTHNKDSSPLLDKGYLILQQLLALMEFINQRTGIIEFGKLKGMSFCP